MTAVGTVHLVGAGPGDPELLTLKAARLLGEADAIVYDRLVSPGLLELAPAAAERIFVGKESGHHAMPQATINALLVALARAGRRVVRLKGGDPLVFGRACEESEHLAGHGVPYEIVPGVTAASGCAAALGIPLTHRGLATGVRYVTGHCRDDGDLDLDWRGLADPATTLVVYMGLANLPMIAKRLRDAGLAADTPAVAVSRGTTARQRCCRATLATLAEATAAARLEAPVLLIVGRVAALARPEALRDQAAPRPAAPRETVAAHG